MKRFSRGRCIGFTLLLLFLSCSLGDECDHEARDWARLERMEDEIHALIGDPLCSDSTDCRFIAFGSKACVRPMICGKLQIAGACDGQVFRFLLCEPKVDFSQDDYTQA